MSIGRGTDFPFQVYGHPDYPNSGFDYTPRSIPGVSTNPKYLGQKCNGVDLQKFPDDFFHDNAGIVLEWLIDAYNQMENKDAFFNKYFLKLAGTKKLQEQIENGTSSLSIQSGWNKDLQKFQKIRKKYLRYRDF